MAQIWPLGKAYAVLALRNKGRLSLASESLVWSATRATGTGSLDVSFRPPEAHSRLRVLLKPPCETWDQEAALPLSLSSTPKQIEAG